MRVYWIDSGVLIQNSRRMHTRVRLPQFWTWLSDQIDAGIIKMPERVYAEVTDGDDWLVDWVVERRDKGLCVFADKAVQDTYTAIADYVEGATKYKHFPHQRDRSFNGADLWVIAHAKQEPDHVVVSQEEKEKAGDGRVKIPSVCGNPKVGVRCYDTYKLLEELNARF